MGLGVIGNLELSRFEPVLVVAGCAFAAISTTGKLLPVRAGIVAAAAQVELDRLAEPCSLVTLLAFQFVVFAFQRELGGVVVELATDVSHDQLETTGVVATGTRLVAERRAVRALVAIDAIVVLELDEARLLIFTRRVALHTFETSVQPGEGISGFAVGTVIAELPLVVVLVAVDTLRNQSQQRAVHVALDRGSFDRRDVLRSVALGAGLLFVVADQGPTGARVIELLLRQRCPLNEIGVFAVVLGVTDAARLAAVGFVNHSRMEAAASIDARGNLGMAVEALIGSLAATQAVAIRAVGRAIQGGVGTRQRAGGDLRLGQRDEDKARQ